MELVSGSKKVPFHQTLLEPVPLMPPLIGQCTSLRFNVTDDEIWFTKFYALSKDRMPGLGKD